MKKLSLISFLLFLLLSSFKAGSYIGICGDETYSGHDYMLFEPGHYLHYTEKYDAEIKDLEVVYQYAKNNGIFITLNFLDRPHYGSSLLGGSSDDKIILNAGFPSKNEHNLWFLINLPKTFKDGDMWKWNEAGYLINYIGNRIVNGITYEDCIKLNINNLNNRQEYSRGEGEAYLAKNIGIIEWEFRKSNGEIFNIEIEDYGRLPPINITGRLTLDGRYPAVRYHIGLSNKHELDTSSQITDEMGKFSFIAFGHKVVIRYAPISEDGSLRWDELTEYELFDVEGDITDLILTMGYPALPEKIVIDDFQLSDERCNVGSQQEVSIHASWAWDYSDAANIDVYVNDTKYGTNENGWISFSVQSNNIYEYKWVITDVSNCDVYDIDIDPPSIIWDKVNIVLDDNYRQNISNEQIIWSGRYLHNDEVFQGSLILNDTLTKNMVGKYGYKVMGISDPKYGLTSFTANDDFEVIFDRVNIEVMVSDDRIDVGEEPDITVSGMYEYDSTLFQGSINFVQPLSHTDAGEYDIKVESINDPLYGLTSYTQNEVKCIWDMMKIVDGGVSQESTIVKNSETVWFKAEYDYDSEIFDGSKGVLYVNTEPLEWSSSNSRWEKEVTSDSPTTKTYEVTGVQDDKYGLTTFNDAVGPLSIRWRQQGIPGFSYKSIIIGVIVGILLLWCMKKRV